MTTKIPDFINTARIPSSAITADIPPQDYIDGYMLPRGVCTLLATAGGSGKTTSGLSAAVFSASRGEFQFFGYRKHDRSLKVMLVLGEETTGMISRKLAHEIVGGIDAYRAADSQSNVAIISWIDYASQQQTPEKLFGETGALTESGKRLWAAIREYQPDFVFFDTLSSLSDGDYLQDRVAYTTLRELNALAAATNAAIVMTSHLVKGGASKVSEKSCADDLIALSRGSAAIVNASRHAITLVPAPADAYPGIEVSTGEEIWLAGVKSNVGFSLANRVFPVIRSASLRTFTVQTSGGQSIADQAAGREKDIIADLEDYLYCTIEYAASTLQPFAESGKMSPAKLYDDLLAPVLPRHASAALVERATDNLIRKKLVQVARQTATGTGYLDVADGPFASPDLHLDEAGKPPRFRKGAPDIAGMSDHIQRKVDELRGDRQARGDATTVAAAALPPLEFEGGLSADDIARMN